MYQNLFPSICYMNSIMYLSLNERITSYFFFFKLNSNEYPFLKCVENMRKLWNFTSIILHNDIFLNMGIIKIKNCHKCSNIWQFNRMVRAHSIVYTSSHKMTNDARCNQMSSGSLFDHLVCIAPFVIIPAHYFYEVSCHYLSHSGVNDRCSGIPNDIG